MLALRQRPQTWCFAAEFSTANPLMVFQLLKKPTLVAPVG
jgi:hypothetical protein